MTKKIELPNIDAFKAPLKRGKVTRLFCSKCGKVHELNMGQAQVFNWTIDRKTMKERYEDYFFQSKSCTYCGQKYQDLELRKIELIPLYKELENIYYLN